MAGSRPFRAEGRHEPCAERAFHGRMRGQQRRQDPAEHERDDDRQRERGRPAPIAGATGEGGGLGGNGRTLHWITRSARSSIDWGMVSPSALAVLRLITSSYFVGCSMGRSPGLAPLRIPTRYTFPAGCAWVVNGRA